MVVKVLAGLVGLVIVFAIYVSTRDGHFRYERSGVINAKPEVIYPYISQFQLAKEWSPYEKDSEIKRTLGGVDGQPGAYEEFDSKQSGSGRIIES